MKICVVGYSCQSIPLAGGMQALLPDHEVHGFDLRRIFLEGREDDVAKIIASCGLIFAKLGGPCPTRVRDVLDEKATRTIKWDNFIFTAFHPDMVYISDKRADGRPIFLQSAFGDYNSRIIAGAYVAGRTVSEVMDLFNSFTYARLGYFDEYRLAVGQLRRIGEFMDVDLVNCLPRWLESGCFMYSFNHPRMIVLLDLARLLLKRASVSPAVDYIDPGSVRGDLSGVTWPVYPEIAKRLGVPGDLTFKPRNRTITLEQMIKGSFDSYTASSERLRELLLSNEYVKKASEHFS